MAAQGPRVAHLRRWALSALCIAIVANALLLNYPHHYEAGLLAAATALLALAVAIRLRARHDSRQLASMDLSDAQVVLRIRGRNATAAVSAFVAAMLVVDVLLQW